MPHLTACRASEFRLGLPSPTSHPPSHPLQALPCSPQRTQTRWCRWRVYLPVPSALCGSPVGCRVKQVDLHQPFRHHRYQCLSAPTFDKNRSISVDWLTSQARYVRVGFSRRTLPRFIWFTMPSLSQALLLEDLPSSHSTFQGHAAHTARWPAMLRPKGSWGACTPQGIIHSSIVLHGADLYTPRSLDIPSVSFHGAHNPYNIV